MSQDRVRRVIVMSIIVIIALHLLLLMVTILGMLMVMGGRAASLIQLTARGWTDIGRDV